MYVYSLDHLRNNRSIIIPIFHTNFNCKLFLIFKIDILAAGAALGRAGLWEESIQFAKSNNEIRTKFGRVSF